MADLGRAKELFLAGVACQERGELDEAERCYRQALELAPERPSVINNLATVLLMCGRFAEAESLCRKLLSTNPRDATVVLNLGNCQLALESAAAALASFDAALALRPGYVEALVGRASALLALNRVPEALASCDMALAIDPDRVEALSNRGVCLRRLNRHEEALSSFRRALAVDPRCADALAGQGYVLLYLARLDEALASCERALAIRPDHPQALENSSLVLLATSRLEEGWKAYQRRWTRRKLGIARVSAETLASLASGSAIGLRGEQGLGDQAFFLRWLPALRQRGLKPHLDVEPRLRRLLAHSPDIAAEDLEGSARATPAVTVALGDLPLLLWGGERYPGSIRLVPSAGVLDAMKVRLRMLGPPPYLGVAWRAGTPPEAQSAEGVALSKAVPLEALARVLAGTTATVVSVQRNPEAGETDALARLARLPVHDLSAANGELEEALALMAILDEYVGVSSTNVHLRHGVGRPSKVLVPNPPEWRWGVEGESPWFPGTAVYREIVGRGWDESVVRLRRDLGVST